MFTETLTRFQWQSRSTAQVTLEPLDAERECCRIGLATRKKVNARHHKFAKQIKDSENSQSAAPVQPLLATSRPWSPTLPEWRARPQSPALINASLCKWLESSQ